MSEQWIDPILNLKNEMDRNCFLKKLETRRNLPVTIRQIEEAIVFLQNRLDDEWLTLRPFGSSAHVNVRIGSKGQLALDFFSIVLRLGFALLVLRKLKGSDELISKLNLYSYDRFSAIVEIVSAARYKIAGYDIELKPSTQKGRFCDFRVRFNEEWIYFECKKENPIESQYFKKASRFADELMSLVLARVGGRLPMTHRIDIMLHHQPHRDSLPEVVRSVSDCIDAGQFNNWKKVGKIEYAINPKTLRVSPPPPLSVRFSLGKAETTPKSLAQVTNIQVFCDPFGSKEKQKARRLIREARDQLPKDSRSIMIIESLHPQILVRIAEEKLKQKGYESVIAISVVGDVPTGNKRWLTLNEPHRGFPLDFLKVGISPGPI